MAATSASDWVPVGTLRSNESIGTQSTDYTLTYTDDFTLADATLGAVTITLPSATSYSGKVFTIKKIDTTANVIKIVPSLNQTIDGMPQMVLQNQYSLVCLISNGANWYLK